MMKRGISRRSWFHGLAVLPWSAACARRTGHAQSQPQGNTMNEKDIPRWLAKAGDSHAPLLARIQAVEELSKVQDQATRAAVAALWRRQRVAPADPPLDFDPEGAERVVDQYLILAHYRYDDASLLPELPRLVERARAVLAGPENELTNAAKVVRAIDRSGPVQALADLAGSSAKAAPNAVRVLQQLGVPAPPTGGPIVVAGLDAPVSFTVHRLREELEQIAARSNGKIVLSPGTRQFITQRDFDRGEVSRENRTLASIIADDLDMLDLTYAAAPDQVTILTFEEAAPLWRQYVRRPKP